MDIQASLNRGNSSANNRTGGGRTNLASSLIKDTAPVVTVTSSSTKNVFMNQNSYMVNLIHVSPENGSSSFSHHTITNLEDHDSSLLGHHHHEDNSAFQRQKKFF